jgi:hypothetical protein
MPYTKPRITRPLPRATPRRAPWRAAKPHPAATQPFSSQLGTWNFGVRVYVAWDPPSAANPAWIEVTQFVDIPATITITRGRPDGESAPQVGTCNLTVDNSDGRWSPANPNGAWFGQIRKGCWLRVDLVPPSQTVSTRYVGFVQQLPVSWEGQYSKTMISASDRFLLLGNAPNFMTMVIEQWLSDPQAGKWISLYCPLHEPSGVTYASDVSGLAPAGASTLTVQSFGVSAGLGIAFGQAPAPGYDGVSTVTFSPSGTLIGNAFGGNTGALPNGSYLTAVLPPMGNIAQVTCSVQTTVALQPIWSWADPASNYVFGISLDAAGYLMIWQESLSQVSATIGNWQVGTIGRYPLNDGAWHQVSIKLQTAASGLAFIATIVDGIQTNFFNLGSNPAAGIVVPATLTRFILGGAESWSIAAIPVIKSLFTGSISDLVIHTLPNLTINPDWYSAWQAATNAWQSPNAAYPNAESCGRRIIRLASYLGLPVPTATFSVNGPALTEVALGATPFVNVPAETAHPAGFQQLAGTQPLTALQTAAATENMPLFMDRQNRLTLQPSTLRQNPTTAFTIDARDLDPATAWADDFQYLQNQTTITPSGGGALVVNTNGLASQALNGIYSPNSPSTVTVNALESGSLGAAINAAGANPQPRHNPLSCEVATLATQAGYGPSWYDAVLASEISSVATVTNWPTQSPGGPSGSYYIEGYTETISGGNHLFAWNTSPAQGPTYQLDSPTLGLIDTPGITLAY